MQKDIRKLRRLINFSIAMEVLTLIAAAVLGAYAIFYSEEPLTGLAIIPLVMLALQFGGQVSKSRILLDKLLEISGGPKEEQ